MASGSRPSPLPRHILEDGVGVEFGWWARARLHLPALLGERELYSAGQSAVA